MLLELEYRPPMSNSASNENTLKCRDHFFPFFFGFFSDSTTPSAALLLLLRAKKKNKNIPAIAARTTGTAIAALRPDEHEMLSQDFSDTVTAPVVLLAAFDAVPDVLPEPVALAPGEDGDTDVKSVVGAALPPEADAAEPVALALPALDGAGLRPSVVAVAVAVPFPNSSESEEAKLANAPVWGLSVPVPVTPVKVP